MLLLYYQKLLFGFHLCISILEFKWRRIARAIEKNDYLCISILEFKYPISLKMDDI